MAVKNCVLSKRKIGGKTYSLKSAKNGVSALKKNILVKKLKNTYRSVRVIKISKSPALYRVYAWGKKRK